MKVYLLWHSHPEDPDDDNDKLLGVYSSREMAEERIETRYSELRAFKD